MTKLIVYTKKLLLDDEFPHKNIADLPGSATQPRDISRFMSERGFEFAGNYAGELYTPLVFFKSTGYDTIVAPAVNEQGHTIRDQEAIYIKKTKIVP